MTLEYHFANFYDSGFDNQNESSICDDNQDLLNVAFLDSPENSISCLYKDASRNNLANSRCSGKDDKKWISTAKRKLMPGYGDLYTEIGNIQYAETSETADASERCEVKPECIFTSTCIDEFQKSPKEYDWTKFKNRPNCVEESEKTEQAVELLKRNEEKPECIFTSTCLDEFQKSPKECDWSKHEKKSYGDDESEKMEPKLPVPVSRFDYVPHELSTILEVDSSFMDESDEQIMNSEKYSSFFLQGFKIPKCLEAEDSLKNIKKPKPSSNFSANVMKVIQTNHIEKLLQEPGILEESDLTLISADFDSTCKISEKSTDKGYCHSYYKIKRFGDVESPSLMSFLQHELSCMKDCADE